MPKTDATERFIRLLSRAFKVELDEEMQAALEDAFSDAVEARIDQRERDAEWGRRNNY